MNRLKDVLLVVMCLVVIVQAVAFTGTGQAVAREVFDTLVVNTVDNPVVAKLVNTPSEPVAVAGRVRVTNAAGDPVPVAPQGTANVNVTNASFPVSGSVTVGNLPLDESGKVKVSATTAASRLILLAENVDMGGGAFFESSFTDTSDCRSITILVQQPPGGQIIPYIMRIGINNVPIGEIPSSGIIGWKNTHTPMYYSTNSGILPVTAPQAQIVLWNGGGSQRLEKLYLFCSR